MIQLIVQKYGGTSVGTLKRIENVANHIHHTYKQGRAKVVVVVSAMGTYTDELYEMAHTLNPHPPKRELDMLVTSGERISTALLSIALDKLKIPSLSLTGSQSGILTDDTHGNARIHKILGHRIKEALEERKVVIVAGFQGMSPVSKDITTLGRGGSDLTAIALASALNANICQIYTDVDGVMTADPRFVPKAGLLRTLPWSAMSQLAWAGAGVLHHRGAFLAHKFKLPVEIRSSLKPEQPGTTVKGDLETMESAVFYAITHKSNMSLLKITLSTSKTPEIVLSQALAWLWKNEESPGIFRFTQNNHQTVCEVLLSERLTQGFLDQVEGLSRAEGGNASLVDQKKNISSLTIVGDGFRQSPEVCERAFRALGSSPLFFEIKDNAMTLCVPMDQMNRALNALHAQFFAGETSSS